MRLVVSTPSRSDVHEHEVVGFGRKPRDRVGAAFDNFIGQAELVEIGADQHAVHGIVLDHEDVAAEGARALRILVRGRHRTLGRNGEPKQAALTGHTLAADLAAHQLDEPPRDGKPEASAAILPRHGTIGLHVRLE